MTHDVIMACVFGVWMLLMSFAAHALRERVRAKRRARRP